MPTADTGLAEIELVRELIALQAPLRSLPLAERRTQYERAERAFASDQASHERAVVDAGGCTAEWVLAQRTQAQPVVVYLHGGGYSIGSSRSHRHLSAAVGRAAGAAVLSVDYRRAPEFPFPAAVHDAVAATRWLFQRTSAPIAVAGDSAGGGLVLATMLALRDTGHPLPVAGVCISPWVDLTCSSSAHRRLAGRDPLLSTHELSRMARWYLQRANPRHPLASPAYADLTGLPPLLIQVGTEEILLDDARQLARAARRNGVAATLQEWPGMMHSWHWYFPVLADGRRAIASIGQFVRRHTSAQAPERCRPRPPREPAQAPCEPSLIQQAHLQVASATSGRGFLSWVYQLNGPLNVRALALALDDLVRRHDILRVVFERRGGRLYQTVTPFVPGQLRVVSLHGTAKRAALDTSVAELKTLYESFSPLDDPRFRARLYTIDRKTSVLAMFVAEALVDSDSGALLSGEITRAYAAHAGVESPGAPPRASGRSYLSQLASHPPSSAAVERARAHWTRQALHAEPAIHAAPAIRAEPAIHAAPAIRAAPAAEGRTSATDDPPSGGSACSFQLPPARWKQIEARARSLHTTPYVLMLSCLQIALNRHAGIARFLAHAVVSCRDDPSRHVIGNFHSLVRIDLRLQADAPFGQTVARTGVAVAQAAEHAVLPAPLALADANGHDARDALAGIRFYMFANHGGPMFPGVRRRRFRLHGPPPAALAVSCIYGPHGRQDFVLSSAVQPQYQLEELAAGLRAAVDAQADAAARAEATARGEAETRAEAARSPLAAGRTLCRQGG